MYFRDRNIPSAYHTRSWKYVILPSDRSRRLITRNLVVLHCDFAMPPPTDVSASAVTAVVNILVARRRVYDFSCISGKNNMSWHTMPRSEGDHYSFGRYP